ncbi:MAG: deoxyuridine 5'-triphosphate nucleotidohydrolase [Clostridiales bacterium]|nr:deoxyuridine 5'-triphosphate nucleotidohydrolase [Clostridiales bacterium]
MQRIANFQNVSRARFEQDWRAAFADGRYPVPLPEECRLPERATQGSAGYDFFAPMAFTLHPGESIRIPTGVRVEMEPGWMLQLYPRSGLGFKFRLQMDNTVGIVDSDYYNSDNEGHIFAKLTNDGREGRSVSLEAGQAFMQGVFVPYGITWNDAAQGRRTGGFGSTDARRSE